MPIQIQEWLPVVFQVRREAPLLVPRSSTIMSTYILLLVVPAQSSPGYGSEMNCPLKTMPAIPDTIEAGKNWSTIVGRSAQGGRLPQQEQGTLHHPRSRPYFPLRRSCRRDSLRQDGGVLRSVLKISGAQASKLGTSRPILNNEEEK